MPVNGFTAKTVRKTSKSKATLGYSPLSPDATEISMKNENKTLVTLLAPPIGITMLTTNGSNQYSENHYTFQYLENFHGKVRF